jgi:hypothetical protein
MATVAGETRVVLEDRPPSVPIVPGEAPAVVAEYYDTQGDGVVAPELEITTPQGTAPRLDTLQTERAALERSRSDTEQRLKSANSFVRPYLEQELARLEGRVRFLDNEIERLSGTTVMLGKNPGSLVARGLGDLLA